MDNQNFVLHYGDLTDSSNLTRILQEVQPDEVYNLGAQSHVAVSFEAPEYTADVVGMGTCACLRRFVCWDWRRTRFYQASTWKNSMTNFDTHQLVVVTPSYEDVDPSFRDPNNIPGQTLREIAAELYYAPSDAAHD